ncbi:hypothetical protein J1N35_032308 [Gossypium stocksii]|uniref:Uncharacterized protein n=1 Tax=Gossypium stocksii TaxID=47602 RepID=A0A9D3V340_9ROSI|nr:hypothetical protein J1N35_032308 [Gossypium stocksii]
MMPRYDPVLEGGELALSCTKMKAIPSPETLEFGKGEILMVKVVEKEAGQATTGWWNRTRPTFSSGEVELLLGSGVRLRYPLPAVTEPMQIKLPFVQLLGSKDGKEKMCGSIREVEDAWSRKV